MMMNKIKSKMIIIQSINKNESKRNIEKPSSGLNLNLSSAVCKKEINKSDNNENNINNEINNINYFLSENKIEDKITASNYVLSTCERKNILNSRIYDNLNRNSHQAIKLGLSGFNDDIYFEFKTKPPCDPEKLKNFDLRENGNKFDNKVCESEGNSPYKKRSTLLPFNHKSPFERTAGRENNFNNSNENNSNNFISSSYFKSQRDVETMNNLNGANKNTINNKDKSKNVYNKGKNESKVYLKNNNKNEVYKNNLNDIIIEEEHDLEH